MYSKDVIILKNDRLIPNFYYASNKNIANNNLYEKFGLANDIVIHKNLASKLIMLIPVLNLMKLKLLVTDAYRPLEIQRYLFENWEKFTGQKPLESLAHSESAPHTMGIAIDAVLTNEKGEKLPQPSSSVKFNPEQRNPDYIFPDIPSEKEKEKNRNLLRILMVCSGISPINKEWFHFQLPNKELYPIITLDDLENIDVLEYTDIMCDTFHYYDIPVDYANDKFLNKDHFWINDASYFDHFRKMGFPDFCEKLTKSS